MDTNWSSTFWEHICDGENPLDFQLALNSSTPEFNNCTKDTILTWPIAGFLFFGTIYQIYDWVSKGRYGRVKWSWLIRFKLLISFMAFGITSAKMIIQIVRIITDRENPMALASDIARVLDFLYTLDLLILTETNRRLGRRSSGVVWLGWLLLAICNSLPFIQSAVNFSVGSDNISNWWTYWQDLLFIFYYPTVLLALILNSFADTHKYQVLSDQKECPEAGASFFSRIMCFWFTSTAILGYKRALVMEDLWKLRQPDAAECVVPHWEKYWNQALEEKQSQAATVRSSTDGQSSTDAACPSLIVNLVKMVKWQLMPAIVFRLTGDLLSFASPQILKVLLTFIEKPSIPLWIGLLLAFLMFLCSTAQTTFQQQAIYRMLNMAMNVRTALTSTVYKKALHLSPTSRKDWTTGELVNLMAVDVQKIGDVFQFVQQLWATPIMIVISLYFLYGELGFSAAVGFGVMLLLLPLNYLISRFQKKNQIRMMKFKDNRMKMMNEILNGMKVLKLYAWEEAFERKVLQVRDNELQTLKVGAYFDALNTLTMFCTPFLVAVASFAAFVLSSPHHILTAQKAFVSLALFNILRQPLSSLPYFISIMVQASVSHKRLKNFLSWPELNPNLVIKQGRHEESILMEHGSFAWSERDDRPALTDINLPIERGQLVAVVGPVGCGKSSLLSAILGDMEPKGGDVFIRGSLAYVPQQAWIQSLTLRNNILFTKEFNENIYERVIAACALKQDFEILLDGDATEIGEKGITLSGGQKQRVSLARAVYQDRDVYLLDDPLSAVDAHVGRHIFNEVIGNDGLLKGKTRVLVTHSLAYLKHMDNIFVMKDGKITQSGTLTDLLQQRGPFADILETYLVQQSQDPNASEHDKAFMDEIMEELQRTDPTIKERLQARSLSISSEGSGTSGPMSPSSRSAKGDIMEDSREQQGANSSHSEQRQHLGQNIKHEVVQKGKVKWRVYTDYFSAVGYFSFFAVLMAYLANAALGVGTNVWLSEWSMDSKNLSNVSMRVTTRLEVYASFGIGQALCVFLAALIGVRLMVSASAKLHKILVSTLIRSPMSFYDVTPLGSIITRVGKDVETVDSSLPMNLRMWMMQALNIVSAVVVILMNTPIISTAMVPLALLYYFLQKFYISTARQLRRLESATRAPIYSHFGETLAGASSIRAYDVQRQFVDEANFRIDENMRVAYATLVSNRWREILLQIMGNFLVMFTALFAVLARGSGIAAGVVGLSVTYASSITNTLQTVIRVLTDLETNLVSVERIQEYSDLPMEAPWKTDLSPPPGWPSQGVVSFEHFQLRYRPGQELVLRGLDWRIDSEEKVGVVGRTGAGKSSMTLALFRIVEAAGGRILIDNIDISRIGLHDLRSRLAIIPQDPVLFSGTLRMNLDPFYQYNDNEVWNALEHAHLKPFVVQLTDGLYYKITEGGENLSVGQRQLVCLARALLRRSKILVLDEATAAVDLETESLILDTIRNQFSDCTIITIAHRLNTIMDNDKILVMSHGRALEHGQPEDLLSNANSSFFSMAKDAEIIGM